MWRGPVSSTWTKAGDKLTLKAVVPVNVEAIVELPAGAYRVTAPRGASAQAVGGEAGATRYRVGSGTWTFTTR